MTLKMTDLQDYHRDIYFIIIDEYIGHVTSIFISFEHSYIFSKFLVSTHNALFRGFGSCQILSSCAVTAHESLTGSFQASPRELTVPSFLRMVNRVGCSV